MLARLAVVDQHLTELLRSLVCRTFGRVHVVDVVLHVPVGEHSSVDPNTRQCMPWRSRTRSNRIGSARFIYVLGAVSSVCPGSDIDCATTAMNPKGMSKPSPWSQTHDCDTARGKLPSAQTLLIHVRRHDEGSLPVVGGVLDGGRTRGQMKCEQSSNTQSD